MEKINKIIEYKGQQYEHVIEDHPNQFCDFCAFGNICPLVLWRELDFNESPMKICEQLCDEAGTGFAYFRESQ